MSNNNTFEKTVESLFKGMDSFITTKTVVGDAIHIGDTIILPLVDVSFGVGAGTYRGTGKEKASDSGAGGMGGKITPSAVLVIQNGRTKLVNIHSQDTVTKILDFVPDVIDQVASKFDKKGNKVTEKDIDEMLDQAADSVEYEE
jgi:uncharacterized spore protein YtfJ